MFPPGKWDDQYDIGYQWRGGTNREEIPFTHGRFGNGYFCQICVKGGCENMTHLPITPPPPPPGKGLYIKVLTFFTFLKKLWTFIPFFDFFSFLIFDQTRLLQTSHTIGHWTHLPDWTSSCEVSILSWHLCAHWQGPWGPYLWQDWWRGSHETKWRHLDSR